MLTNFAEKINFKIFKKFADPQREIVLFVEISNTYTEVEKVAM
jgi:hypothetical protein